MYIFADDDDYCSILHVFIIVLAIYTFGTSLLLWWLYKKFAKLCCNNVKDYSKGICHLYTVYIPTYVHDVHRLIKRIFHLAYMYVRMFQAIIIIATQLPSSL